MFFLPLRHDHRRASLDRLFDELVAIAFLAAQARRKELFFCTRRESYAMLSTSRSSGPMTWRGVNGGCENFELHEVWTRERKVLNGVRHWLRQLVPPHSALPSSSCGSRSR